MVFSSIPSAYLDSANWQQPQNHQLGSSTTPTSSLLPVTSPQPAEPPLRQPHGGGGLGSIRPGSLSERARIANIPMPEAALKCPRCDSTNTKFCYFNNYNLSQPRHFCKTCRRYWTRGGALRNVPVGGGCRRNKRSKGSNTKSPVTSDGQITSSATSTSTICSNDGNITANILGISPQLPSLRFVTPFSQLTDNYGSGDVSLNYSGNAASLVGTNETNFQVESNLVLSGNHIGEGVTNALLSSGGIEQWRFPFLGGLDASPALGLYQFQGGIEQSGFGPAGDHQSLRPKLSSSMLSQLASVKLEENPAGLNLSRQFVGNDQWSSGAAGGASWTDLSSFSSSTTSNPL